ncbi:MAG: lysophospholipid acyltransferase family protein [Oligoflexales bacterium]|nr:lysophospholipid acyltransferase family protein [Oligoflexales bacterium]
MHIFLNVMSFLLSKLSPKNLERLAYGITFLFFRVIGLRKKLILKNLDIVFGDQKSQKQKERIGFESYYHFVLTSLEFLAERDGKLGDQVSIEGEHYLAEAKKQGNGAYILCIHMGSWEAMGSALTRLGYPSNVIVKKVGSEKMDRFINDLRRRNGFYSIVRRKKGDAVKGIKRALERNELVGFVMDQARPGEPMLPFFNKPAKTNTSFAAIHRRIPAPIIPVYITRVKAGQHRLKVLAPLEMNGREADGADVETKSLAFNRVVEDMIMACPEQYFWMHNRWKLS